MRFFARRRLTSAVAMLATLAAAWAWNWQLEAKLKSSSFFTGWLLLGSIAFLAAFQLRKKLPAPSLGSASLWMQAHIYVGLATAALFAMHAGWKWPDGMLESTLAALYGATFLSGTIGLYWTRVLPRRLTLAGDEVIYERVAAARGALRDRAQAAVLQTVRSAGAATLGEFYQARLHDYFSQRRGWRYLLWPNSRLRKSLLAELTEHVRYLSEPERQTAETLFALVRSRDDLDFHEALQWRLRAWQFVHIALTYPLLLAAGWHSWMAYVFSGEVP